MKDRPRDALRKDVGDHDVPFQVLQQAGATKLVVLQEFSSAQDVLGLFEGDGVESHIHS